MSSSHDLPVSVSVQYILGGNEDEAKQQHSVTSFVWNESNVQPAHMGLPNGQDPIQVQYVKHETIFIALSCQCQMEEYELLVTHSSLPRLASNSPNSHNQATFPTARYMTMESYRYCSKVDQWL